jgi:hypothetical protein
LPAIAQSLFRLYLQGDGLNDPLLADAKHLAVDIKARMPAETPVPEAPVARTEERPHVVAALETAAFEPETDDDGTIVAFSCHCIWRAKYRRCIVLQVPSLFRCVKRIPRY